MSKYFISYNQADAPWGLWLEHQVRTLGHEVFLRAWDIRAGDNFIAAMHDQLQTCDKMLMLLSKHYLAGVFTHEEWQAAYALRHRIIPFLIDETEPSGLLAPLSYVELKGLGSADAETAVRHAIHPPGRPLSPPPFPGSA